MKRFLVVLMFLALLVGCGEEEPQMDTSIMESNRIHDKAIGLMQKYGFAIEEHPIEWVGDMGMTSSPSMGIIRKKMVKNRVSAEVVPTGDWELSDITFQTFYNLAKVPEWADDIGAFD